MKKIKFLLFLLFISFSLFAQINVASKQIYLDSLGCETTRENHCYTRVFTNFSQKTNRYLVTDYYKNGRKKMTGTSLAKDVLKKDGEFICYFRNGAKQSAIDYSEDHKSGKEIQWYENQSKKFEKKNIWNPKTKTCQTLILNFWTKDKEQIVTDGNGECEDSDGFITEKGTIKNGLKQGVWQGNDIASKISFTDNYDKGILISGVSVDENNIKFSYSSLNQKQKGKNTPKTK